MEIERRILMEKIQLQVLDANNFVYQMIKMASSTKYMYNSQIKGLIDYTKHYYSCESSDEQLTEIFNKTIRNLGW